jgi:hypothetical protein
LRSCGNNIASNFERPCARPIWSNGAPLIYPMLRFEVREQGKGPCSLLGHSPCRDSLFEDDRLVRQQHRKKERHAQEVALCGE